jgi:hypothetical protein
MVMRDVKCGFRFRCGVVDVMRGTDKPHEPPLASLFDFFVSKLKYVLAGKIVNYPLAF